MNNQYDNNYPPQQPYPPQPNYQQPGYQPYGMQRDTPETVGQWVLTLFLTAIPIVGIVMLFIWAFGSNSSVSKSNWAKAALIWMLIGIVLSFLFMGILVSILGSIAGTHSTF
jgi:hypothetical protein